MTADELIRKLKPVLERWPAGMTVWHRADGTRGIIAEHCIDGQGCIMLFVSIGPAEHWQKCALCELSAVKISAGADGDEWKDTEPDSAAP